MTISGKQHHRTSFTIALSRCRRAVIHLKGCCEGIDGGSIQMVAGLVQQQQVAGHQGKCRQGYPGLLPPTQITCEQHTWYLSN